MIKYKKVFTSLCFMGRKLYISQDLTQMQHQGKKISKDEPWRSNEMVRKQSSTELEQGDRSTSASFPDEKEDLSNRHLKRVYLNALSLAHKWPDLLHLVQDLRIYVIAP